MADHRTIVLGPLRPASLPGDHARVQDPQAILLPTRDGEDPWQYLPVEPCAFILSTMQALYPNRSAGE